MQSSSEYCCTVERLFTRRNVVPSAEYTCFTVHFLPSFSIGTRVPGLNSTYIHNTRYATLPRHAYNTHLALVKAAVPQLHVFFHAWYSTALGSAGLEAPYRRSRDFTANMILYLQQSHNTLRRVSLSPPLLLFGVPRYSTCTPAGVATSVVMVADAVSPGW